MPKIVNVEGIGELVFPDGMSEPDMLGAIQKNFDWKPQRGASGDWGPQVTPPPFPNFGVSPATTEPLAQGLRNTLEPFRAVGQSIGAVGDLASSAAKDVMTRLDPSMPQVTRPGILGNFENVRALTRNEPQPFDESAGPIQQGIATTAKMVPSLVAAGAGSMVGIPPSVSFPVLSGSETFAKTGDPIAALESAGSAAVIPALQKIGMQGASKVMSNVLKRFVEGSSGVDQEVARALVNSPTAQKAIEVGIGNAAVSAYQAVSRLPEFLQATPDKQKEMLAQAGTEYVAFSLLQWPYFRGRTPSETQRLISEDVPFLMNQMYSSPTTVDLLAREAFNPLKAQEFVETPPKQLPPGEGIYATRPGNLTPRDFGEHQGTGIVVPSEGIDWNVPPVEPAPSATPSRSDLAVQGGAVPPQEAPADAEVLATSVKPESLAPTPGPVEAKAPTLTLAPTLEANIEAQGVTRASPQPVLEQAVAKVIADAQQTLDAGGTLPEPLATELKVVEQPVAPAVPQTLRDILLSDQDGPAKARAIKVTADASGLTVKQAQEVVESTLVKMAHEIAIDPSLTPQAKFEQLLELYQKQPTLSARTSTSVANQAYSTPAPLAYALGHAIDVKSTNDVYDPTAGNGMLLIGGDFGRSHGNELNPERQAALGALGINMVTPNDATKYTPSNEYSKIMANPPFGGIDTVGWQGYAIKRLEHLIALRALNAMRPDGQAAIILGAKREEGPEQFKGAQWVFENYLYGNYNVVGNFEVEGDLYAKQGVKWPVRVLVIDGKRMPPVGGELAPKSVARLKSWDQVWEEAERIRNEIDQRRQTVVPAGAPGVSVPAPAQPAAAKKPRKLSIPSERPAPTAVPGGEPGGIGGRERGVETRPPSGSIEPTAEQPVPERQGAGNVSPAPAPTDGGRKPDARVESGLPRGAVTPPNVVPGSTPGSPGAEPGIISGKAYVAPPEIKGTDAQVTYIPRSRAAAFGTLTPKTSAAGMFEALDKLVAKVGPIDDYVANRLNMEPAELMSIMSAEQIDGVAQGIDQIESGGALIVGHETGVGKGRIGASVIRYAMLNGKIPIFFTKDPKLFTDMYGDLKDIHTDIKPFILGDPSKASIVDRDGEVIHRSPALPKQQSEMQRILQVGFENSGYNAIFVTYSQINKRNPRQEFLEQLTERNPTVVVMDESHDAAGDLKTSMQAVFFVGGPIKKGKGSDQRTYMLPGLLRQPGTRQGQGGVMYLSATFAKRSENMPVYFRTSLNQASESFANIVEAMKKGGVALQQAVSEALSKAGQYTRVERDFTGVSYSMKRVSVKDEAALIDHVDQVTDVLSEIVRFSGAIREVVEESTAQTESQTSMTDFASVVHNQVGQLLLAAKADAVIEEAIAAHKRGEKPLVALMNTMEAFLTQYADDAGIKPGQKIQLRWNELLKYALSRTLRQSEKDETGNTHVSTVDPDDYGLGDRYREILSLADAIETKFPVSPIDYIIQKLALAGIRMGELTGRESGIQYTNFDTGEAVYRYFKKANKNAIVNGFNGGDLEGMLLNASGSTGLSAHASEKFKDQKPRNMIIAQPALDINVFVQTLGRIKRTGMVMLGLDEFGGRYGARYLHLVLPLQAELRPAAMAARKMKSLNANTTAETNNAIKIESEDMFNRYGDRVVAEYLDQQNELQGGLGLQLEYNEDGTPKVADDLAKQFTGRLAIRPNSEQLAAYEHIIPAYQEKIAQLKASGEYDLEVVLHDDWDAKQKADQELSAGTDESNIFTAGVRLQQWEIKDNRHIPTGEEMRAEFFKRLGSKSEAVAQWSGTKDKITAGFKAKAETLKRRLMEEAEEADKQRVRSQMDALQSQFDRWNATSKTVDSIMREAGSPVELVNNETGETYTGLLVDAKMPTSINHTSASNFRFKFLVETPGGTLYIPASEFNGEQWSIEPSTKAISELTGAAERRGAIDRYFLVGNPIRAYEATAGKGKLVRFQSSEGQTVTGLMMPRNWGPSKLAKDPRIELVSAQAAANFLRNFGEQGYRNYLPIESGVVRVVKMYGGGYAVSVPSAKGTGGKIYLDEELRRITGDFTKVGNKMRTDIEESMLVPVLARIQQITTTRFRAVGTVNNELMRQVSQSNGGQALSAATVPTSNVPTLVDSQGLIDRALAEGGGDAALKALVPNVRIRYGPLPTGVPAEYEGGVITLNKQVLDFIATKYPEQAQDAVNKLMAEELTHAIADTVLTTFDYIRIGETMSAKDKADLLALRPEIAAMLNRVEQSRNLGGEYVANVLLKENEQSRPIDPNSTFGQRILAALQKLWDYLTAALKRFQGRNTVIEQALKKVRQAKADVLAGKTPTFEQGDPLNAKAIKDAMELYREKPTPESERALRIAQAGEVVLARPVAQEALKQLRSQAGISKEEIAANPEQAAALRTKRDVAKRVLSTPFVKRNFVMPSEHYQAALNALNGDLETFDKIRNDPNATPEEVGTAAGNAFETLQMFEATKTSLLNAIAKRRPAIVRELAKTFDSEAEALENRDVYQVLTQDFKDMGRLLMRMQKDQAVLSAYKQATSNTAATKNVLKFIHDNMDFSGMTTDDLRSIDDLWNRVRSTIVENSGKFPAWNGSNVPEVVGASEGAIRDVLRIISLSEPFRTDLETAKQVVDVKQFSTPLNKIKSELATKLKAGQYEGALGLYEKGLVASGINLKESRDAAAFLLKNTHRLLINLQAIDKVKEIAEEVGSDPELIRQANEVYKFHNIARITHGTPTEGIDKGKSTAITFKRANPADQPITISFGNTIQDQNKIMENARTLASEYQAYIANPDAPGYDPRLAAGMEKDLDLLGRFLDPSRNPKIRGRLVPSLPVRAWDFFSSKLGHFAIIPKYITSGTTGHLADVVDLTRTALSTIGEKGGIILRQHEVRLNNSLDAALKAHGNMNEGEYHLMVLNPLAASRQNFNNPGMLKPGDAIGNGEVVTPADMAYLRAVRAFEGDLFKMIESSGHEFKSVKSMFAGILFDKNGQVRSPITHGPDMTGRDFPPEMQTWVDDWSKAVTPEAKIAFLNHWKDPLLIGFVRGSREVDWKFAYSYPLEMQAIARELNDPSAGPLVNFDDLVRRIFDRQIVEDGVDPKDMDQIAADLLSDFDRIFNKLKPIVAQGGDNPKTELEVIGGSNSFNTPRSVTVMPPGWYNYGVVTAGERAGTLRAASLPFQLAHVKSVRALRDSLARVVNDFASKQTKEGISEYQLRRQSAKQMAAGDILYDFGSAERELQNVDNWLTQLNVMMAKSANPYVKDSVHMAAMRGGAQLVITSIVSGPAAVTKNIAGGYQNLAMLDMLIRRQNFVTALASRGGELVSQVLKELTYLATHEGNPATAGLRKLLEKSENVAFIGDVAKLILGYANQQRESYNYATQAGVNYNIDLWDNIKSKWKFASTLGHPRANDPMWHEAWANRASLAGNSLAQAIGQGSVGYADVRLNTRMLAAALPIEEHFRQMAITWGDKMEASGLFPDKALGQGWWGNDLSAARIRDFFRSSGVGPIDAIMADFYKRWTADKAKEKAEGLPPGSLSSKTPFFTDGQMHQLEQALTEDNNAAYGNRPTFFKQSQAHSKFAPLWGYPTWFIRKLLELTNGLSNKPWYKNLVGNMPMLIQVAIGIAAVATLGYGAASFLKRSLENKVTGFPTVFDAQNPKQAAQAILAATADSIPFIGTALNSVTGAGYRTGFDINSQFLALNFAGDAMRTYKEIAQSGDIGGPLQRFAGRYFFPLNVVGAHAPNVSGLREMSNLKNILVMGARGTGLETKLRRTGSSGSDANYSASTPILNRALNAIGRGDTAGFQSAYADLIEQKRAAGSLNPASSALSALRGRSPLTSVFGTKLSQQELDQVLSNVSPALAARARDTLTRFDAAVAQVPRATATRGVRTLRASRSGGSVRRLGLGRTRLRMPTLRLRKPTLRRLSA